MMLYVVFVAICSLPCAHFRCGRQKESRWSKIKSMVVRKRTPSNMQDISDGLTGEEVAEMSPTSAMRAMDGSKDSGAVSCPFDDTLHCQLANNCHILSCTTPTETSQQESTMPKDSGTAFAPAAPYSNISPASSRKSPMMPLNPHKLPTTFDLVQQMYAAARARDVTYLEVGQPKDDATAKAQPIAQAICVCTTVLNVAKSGSAATLHDLVQFGLPNAGNNAAFS